jgi:bifunctional ADP-heptose synthase (sugar kinase/adenylyltransferase)
VYDVTGAGDTLVATLAVAIAVGCPLELAAKLANCAAGLVVGKVGTASVSATELLVDASCINVEQSGVDHNALEPDVMSFLNVQ